MPHLSHTSRKFGWRKAILACCACLIASGACARKSHEPEIQVLSRKTSPDQQWEAVLELVIASPGIGGAVAWHEVHICRPNQKLSHSSENDPSVVFSIPAESMPREMPTINWVNSTNIKITHVNYLVPSISKAAYNGLTINRSTFKQSEK